MTKTISKTKIAIVFSCAVVIAAGVFWYSRAHRNQEPADAPHPYTSNASSTHSQGTVTDTGKGASTSSTPAPVDADTPIALTAPTSGATITNGSTLSGTSTFSKVEYRIKDTAQGVIASGELAVGADHHFSGIISSISPQSATGTVEVFNYAANGNEEHNTKVTVKFPQ